MLKLFSIIILLFGLVSCQEINLISDNHTHIIKISKFDTTNKINAITNCSILSIHDNTDPDNVNMEVTYDELITCAPILIKYINKSAEFRLRVHQVVFDKIEYFTLNTWNNTTLIDTIYKINVIRIGAQFDKVCVTPEYLINKNNEYVWLGDLRACFNSSNSSFSFIKLNFSPFNINKWENENGIKFNTQQIMKFSKQDTILTINKE